MRTEQFYIKDHIVMFSQYPTPELHAHTALHLIVPVDGELQCSIREQAVVSSGIFIDSDVPHTAVSDSGKMLVFLFDAVSSLSDMIRRNFFCGREYCPVRPKLAEKMRQACKAYENLPELDGEIMRLCGFDQTAVTDMDERIADSIAYLQDMPAVPEDIYKELCGRACLSESRFSHLFKGNTGLSFSHYMVILKMRKFYEGYLAGKNITDAAINAGFSSPSHFAEVCRRQFGISFSDFAKSTR